MRFYKPDPDKAKKLLADAGFANGFTVKLGVIPTFPTMVSGAPVVAAQLKRVGITAEIENVEYAVWIKRWLAKDFDLTMNTLAGYADPDTAFFRALHSTKGQNWNSWSVPELDLLLEEGRRTMDQKKRKEIYDRVQIMILENVPHLWLYSADTIDFTQAYVKGFEAAPQRLTLLYGIPGRLARQGLSPGGGAVASRDRAPAAPPGSRVSRCGEESGRPSDIPTRCRA